MSVQDREDNVTAVCIKISVLNINVQFMTPQTCLAEQMIVVLIVIIDILLNLQKNECIAVIID